MIYVAMSLYILGMALMVGLVEAYESEMNEKVDRFTKYSISILWPLVGVLLWLPIPKSWLKSK